jgi:hypothetical protein
MTDWIDNCARRMNEAFTAPGFHEEALAETLPQSQAPSVSSKPDAVSSNAITRKTLAPTFMEIPHAVTDFFRKMSVFSNLTVQRARLESMRNELADALRFEEKSSTSYTLVHDAVREVEGRLDALGSLHWDEDHALDEKSSIDRTLPEQAKKILTATRLKRARLQPVYTEHSAIGSKLSAAESDLKQLEGAFEQLKKISSPAAKDVMAEVMQKKVEIVSLKFHRSEVEATAKAQDLTALVPLAEAVLREERVTASLEDYVKDSMALHESLSVLDVHTREILERRIVENATELMDLYPKMTVDAAVKQATYDVVYDAADATSGVESKKTLGPRAWEDKDKAEEKDFDIKKIAEKTGK